MKRAYLVGEEDGENGYAYVAENGKEAIKLAFKEDPNDLFCDISYIDIRAKRSKADVTDLPIGMIDDMEGLKRQVYGWFEGLMCPKCNKESMIYSNDGDPCCSTCQEKEE